MYLHPYKKEWQEEYQKEAELIRSKYEGSIELSHIGSTAIEGLYAKDCIDILGIVSNLSIVKANLVCLANIGYAYKGSNGIESREYFSKPRRKAHLHIFQTGHDAIDRHIGFVKIMRANPSLIAELSGLKQRLHAKYPLDKDSYQKEKVDFYNEIHKML